MIPRPGLFQRECSCLFARAGFILGCSVAEAKAVLPKLATQALLIEVETNPAYSSGWQQRIVSGDVDGIVPVTGTCSWLASLQLPVLQE